MSALIKDSDAGERGTEALRQWYEDGADGAIDWGSDGDFEACVAIAGKYMDNPEGYCNERHQAATGAPPGKAPGEDASKAARSDWAKHPSHPFHDAIVEFYAPLIAAALKDAITGVRATITSAQNKYAAGKAKTAKAAGDDVAAETFAQQVARAAAESGIGTSQAELKQILSRMTIDSSLAGVRTAIQQIPGATVPDDLADLYDAVDWDAWEPGNVAAADTLSGGLQAVLDRIPAILNGITDTNVERIGNQIADGLTSGDSVQTIGSNIADMVGNDSRALTIANTQTAMAVSEASMTTYQTNGIDQFEWLAEDDACPICQDNADNSPYDVGDDPDPSQPAHPNCRCAYSPVVKTSPDESDTGDSTDEDSDDSSDEGTGGDDG